MDDLISRQAAIDWLKSEWDGMIISVFKGIKSLPSAQPTADVVQATRLNKELEGKTPEEMYAFLHWLLIDFGKRFTDSRGAVIEWLEGKW